MTPPVADTLLAIDIGNTRIGMAVCDHDGIHDTQRVGIAEPAGWRDALATVWAATRAGRDRAVVIASVNPAQSVAVADLAQSVCGIEPWRVRDDLPLPMPTDVDNPGEIGVDRVCSAAAAYERLRRACAVASFGTAITVDCVSADGRFLGGTILPGLEMSFAALHGRTAALPLVRAAPPGAVFGRNTPDAIRAGVIYGAIGALREIVERFATELHEWPQLVLTGGNAGLIAEQADFVDAVVPDLCLMGIALAYRRAAIAETADADD